MKFKAGDIVEVLPGGRYEGDVRAGMQGTVVRHHDYVDNGVNCARNVYRIKFTDFEGYVVEYCLKLVPGNRDTKQIGNWDECPWSPYRKKVDDAVSS